MAGSVEVNVTPELDPYVPAQEVRVSIEVRDVDSDLADPGTLTLRVLRPDGAELTLTYAAGQIVRDDVGLYHYDLLLSSSLAWRVRVESDNPTAAVEHVIPVAESPFTAELAPLPGPGGGDEGKIARVTGGVWTPYAGGAVNQPLIWTAAGWVGQALNLAAAAAVTGLLALSHIAPGTDGQVMRTVGTATTWVDASSIVGGAGGGNTEVQYNDNGSLNGAANIKVVGGESAFAFGSLPAQGGAIRASNATPIVVARNALNTGDLTLISSDSSDGIKFGASTNVANLYLQTAFGGVHYIYTGTNVEYSFSSTVADFKDSVLQFGTNPSGAGWTRFPGSTQVIIGQRNVANTQNMALLQSDNADGLVLGDNTYTSILIYGVKTGGSHKLQVSNVDEYVFTATALAMNANNINGIGFLDFGGTTPASGRIRLANNIGAFVNYRSYAGNARNLIGLSGDGATFDDLTLGDSNATDGNATLYLGTKTQIIMSIAAGTEYLYNAAGANWQGNSLTNAGFVSASGTVAGSGFVRGANNTTAVAVRNAANSEDIPLLGTDSSNQVLLGGGTVGTTKRVVIRAVGGSSTSSYVFSEAEVDFSINMLKLDCNAGTGKLRFVAGGTPGTTGDGALIQAPHASVVLAALDNTGANYKRLVEWGISANNALRIGMDATGGIAVANNPLAFFGGSPAAKQTVNGAKGGNTALASLLTALAAYSFITDSST